LFRTGDEAGPATGTFILNDNRLLFFLPVDRPVQTGAVTAAAHGTGLFLNGKGPFVRRGGLRQAWSFDDPFLPCLCPALFLSFRRRLREMRNLRDRADQFAQTAAGAGGDIDIAGMTDDGGLEPAGIPREVFHLAMGKEFDI